jgi:hypothetical protein
MTVNNKSELAQTVRKFAIARFPTPQPEQPEPQLINPRGPVQPYLITGYGSTAPEQPLPDKLDIARNENSPS